MSRPFCQFNRNILDASSEQRRIISHKIAKWRITLFSLIDLIVIVLA